MLTVLQPLFRFDPGELKAGFASIGPSEWTRRYNELDYGSDWPGSALRSLPGSSFVGASPYR